MKKKPFLDKKGLIKALQGHFKLEWTGLHGAPHWARVRSYGLELCGLCDADRQVVELFAFLHDCCRQNNLHDPLHGQRAADYAMSLNSVYFRISNRQLEMLHFAIAGHSDGLVHDHPTIQTCWDADRLDLVRLGIEPHPLYLSRWAATIAMKNRQSVAKLRLESRPLRVQGIL
jgi:uncharacterized protein